ncbi:uncharacterized protein SCHCODRAFT_01146793 [Schizophyllum commune H4-8]|nr:uncharacterized protein SCHCODRAFT_01146793 [Schizophyllum commune H4-8]KAI5899386.1 hypothetical protein SCHCODRAFT_01146793 [Schizophyllum commune H4-8]
MPMSSISKDGAAPAAKDAPLSSTPAISSTLVVEQTPYSRTGKSRTSKTSDRRARSSGPIPTPLHKKRRRRLVYAIKLTEEGMRSFNEEHFGPPPAGLTEEQYETWWEKRQCSLSAIIPRHCIHRFNLHAANPSLVTLIRDGNTLESAVAFADNSSRRTSALPSPQLVADVAKYMHQEGDRPQWYRFAKTGD